MTGILLLLTATAGVALGGALGASLVRLTSALDWLLAALVLACAQVTLESILVGAMLKRYDRGSLLLTTFIWDALVSAAWVTTRGPSPPLAAVGRLAVAAVRRLALWQMVIVAAAAAALVWRLVLAVVLPPFAYDALTYHLTVVASWIQTHTVGVNPYAACCARYPSNAELLFAWPTVFLGRDTLTDAVQVVTGLLAAVAVAALARLAGASPAGALTAAALFVLTPIVLTQAYTDYNDVTIAAFFLAALYFAARLVVAPRAPAASLALLTGAAAGLALGSKTNGIVLAAAVVVPLVTLLGVRRHPGLWPVTGTLTAAVFVAGGWWYARNWIEVGNPFSPFEVRVRGVTLFEGPGRLRDYLTVPPGGSRNALVDTARSWLKDITWWSHPLYSYDERRGGLGPVWSWVGWAAVIVVAIGWLRRRRDLAVVVLLPALLAFALLPYRWYSRFTIYLPALAAVAIVLVLERLSPRLLQRFLALVIVVLALAGTALASRSVEPSGHGSPLSSGEVVSLALHPSRPRMVGTLFFHEYAWLETVPQRATIGVEWEAPEIRFLYPLFGSYLDRRVILYDRGDEGAVEASLERDGPDYLFAALGGPYDRWLEHHPGLYRVISTARGTRAFERERDKRRY
jgi:Dolichyl-phosphate-mannose-protein mannosyltransferase